MSKAIDLMLLEIENKQKMCKSSSVRPKLNFKNFVLPFLLILVCIFGFITLLCKCEEISAFLQIPNLFYNILVVSFFILLIAFTAKPVLLWLILLYQKLLIIISLFALSIIPLVLQIYDGHSMATNSNTCRRTIKYIGYCILCWYVNIFCPKRQFKFYHWDFFGIYCVGLYI